MFIDDCQKYYITGRIIISIICEGVIHERFHTLAMNEMIKCSFIIVGDKRRGRVGGDTLHFTAMQLIFVKK